MENNKISKINTGITGVSLFILLLIFILVFQPVVTADGGRKKLDIGTLAGNILNNAARVEEDEEEELEDAAEELTDYKNLSFISELQIIIQYAKYSSDIYDNYSAQFLAYFIFVALVFIMEVFLAVVVFCQILCTILDLSKKNCEIMDICKRMAMIFSVWILPVIAGISFCEYCDAWGYRVNLDLGFAFSMIGILSIIMCVVCMFVHIIIDKALKKQIQSRLIAAVLFFTTIVGMYCLKVDVFKIEYSVEVEDNTFIDTDDKVSLASLPEWETLQTIESIQIINNMVEPEEAAGYVSELVNSVFVLLGGFGCVFLIVITYAISIENFASGMCGRKYSLILQIICSVFSIIFVILLAALMGMGTNQMAGTMEKAYKSAFYSAKCEFQIKYQIGYFIPFIVNIIFIVLSIVKKVFDQKLPISPAVNVNMGYSGNFYPQNQAYPQNMMYSQNQAYLQNMPYSQETGMEQSACMEEPCQKGANICPNCGAENNAGNRFCSRCGQQIR